MPEEFKTKINQVSYLSCWNLNIYALYEQTSRAKGRVLVKQELPKLTATQEVTDVTVSMK